MATRKRSWIWKYFEKLSIHRYRCNLCNSELSIRVHTTNMNRHVKLKHPQVYKAEVLEKQYRLNAEEDIFEKSEDNEFETPEEQAVEKIDNKNIDVAIKEMVRLSALKVIRRRYRSWIWKYFEKLTTSHYRCDMCEMVLIGKNINTLNRHIKLKHNTLYKSVLRKIKLKDLSKREEEDEEVKTGSDCKTEVCNVDNQYPNMEKAYPHVYTYLHLFDEKTESDTSWIWLLFDSSDNNVYFCRICQFRYTRLDDEEENITNILDHLRTEHGLISGDQITIQEDD